VAYDPDGRTLAVGTDSGVELLDAADGAVVAHLPGDVEPTDLAFSADGTQLAATTDLGVSVWDLPTGTSRQLVSDPNSDYSTLAFTSDGQDLVVGTDLGYTAVLDVDSGQVVHQLAAPGQSQATTTPSPVAVVGHELVVGENIVGGIGDVSADVDVWNTTTWTLTTVLTPVSGTSIASVDASPDGTTVAVGNDDGTGGIWSLSPDEELVPISGQTAYLNTLAFSPDSRDLAVVANDGTARIYRADGPWTTTVIADLCSCGNEMAWTSHRLVALNRDGNDLSVQAWLLPSGRPVPGARVLNTDQQDEGAVLSPDGRLAALLDDTTTDSTVTVVDTATGRTVFTLPSLDVAGVAFSPDGRLLAVGDASGGLHVTTLATGRTVVGHGWPTCDPGDGDDLVISADDREVAHSSFCGQVSIGSTATARPTETFDQHQQLSSVAFDPSGTHVAIASWASTTTVVDVATDTAVAELIGHTRGVTGVAYTPSGTYIVTTSNDDTVRVWSASTGQLLRVDHDQSGTGNPSVSPDGQVLAEDNNNDQIRLWTVCPDCADPSALLAASRSSVISPLTPLEREAVAQAG
jgi:WD40 repeat protein